MDPEKTNNPEANEDAALDQELESSIAAVKAGQALQPKVEDKPVEKKEETPTAPKVEEPSNPPANAVKEEGEYEFKLPTPSKTKFESDEAYEKRVELMDLIGKRKAATSPEQKAKITEQINNTRKEMSLLNPTDKITNPLNKSAEDIKKEEEDPDLKADRETLKRLGGATKEDIKEILQEERLAIELSSNIENFVKRHQEMSDEDAREVFFNFVDQNYVWQGKSGKDFLATLEMAYENMFKPSETIQERVLKGAGVQEKVNAMQFPGGTIVKQALSPEMQKSVDEIVATGMSEEKAIELLSD